MFRIRGSYYLSSGIRIFSASPPSSLCLRKYCLLFWQLIDLAFCVFSMWLLTQGVEEARNSDLSSKYRALYTLGPDVRAGLGWAEGQRGHRETDRLGCVSLIPRGWQTQCVSPHFLTPQLKSLKEGINKFIKWWNKAKPEGVISRILHKRLKKLVLVWHS